MADSILQIYWGKDTDLRLNLTRPSTITDSIVGSAIRFSINKSFLLPPILELTRLAGGITVASESASAITAIAHISGSAISTALPEEVYGLLYQVEVIPVGGKPQIVQGKLNVLPVA